MNGNVMFGRPPGGPGRPPRPNRPGRPPRPNGPGYNGGFALPFILGATTASLLTPYYYNPYPYPYPYYPYPYYY